VNDVEFRRGACLSDRKPARGLRTTIGPLAVPRVRFAYNNVGSLNYVGSVIVGDTNGRYFEPAAPRNYIVGVSVGCQPLSGITRTAIALHWADRDSRDLPVRVGLVDAGHSEAAVARASTRSICTSRSEMTNFALMLVRILWRMAHRPAALPELPSWQAEGGANHTLSALRGACRSAARGYLGSEWSGFRSSSSE
jgi:hypothetical protein